MLTVPHFETQNSQNLLLRPPLSSYIRFSRSKLSQDEAIQDISNLCQDCCRSRGWPEDTFTMKPVPFIPDAIVIQAKDQVLDSIQTCQIEVMVDKAVGVSVLRGSDIYKSGILACESSGKGFFKSSKSSVILTIKFRNINELIMGLKWLSMWI